MTKNIFAAALGAVLLVGTAHAAVTAEQKCQQAKLKAQAKLQACVKKNGAKLIGGAVDTSADCRAKFQAGLTKADTKAAAASSACRFVDNGDGTVSDLDSGLVWEQKTNADNTANPADPHDADNVYSVSASGTALDGTAFTTFLAALNTSASTDGAASTAITGCFAGRCDWRLPTIAELQGIVDLSACPATACIDPTFGQTPVYSYYWSATALTADASSAWDVKFGSSGALYSYGKTNVDAVRAVRGGL